MSRINTVEPMKRNKGVRKFKDDEARGGDRSRSSSAKMLATTRRGQRHLKNSWEDEYVF